MDALPSPQPCAVGEASDQKISVNEVMNSYVSILKGQISCEEISNESGTQNSRIDPSKLKLCDVVFDQDFPVVKFSMEDINIFTREEGLHQAVVIKFSYGFPHISEVRKIFASQFDVKGRCNIGQLEYRHFLIRFDIFDDYARFIGKSSSFLKSKGEEFFFRSFPWTFSFDPKEETSMAAIWISLPGLPPNLFAKRSLLSIASAIGKPIAVDKATHDRTRPSTARVKIIINLLDDHPKLVKLQFIDSTSGNSVEIEQRIVYDNLPSYCEYCKHQGHEEIVCRHKSGSKLDDLAVNSMGIGNNVGKLQGDARDLLNKKRDDQVKTGHISKINKKDTGEKKKIDFQKLKAVWRQKIRPEPSMINQNVNNAQSVLLCDTVTNIPNVHAVAKESFSSRDASESQKVCETVLKDKEFQAAAKKTFASVGAPEIQEVSTNIDDARSQSVLDCEDETNVPNVDAFKESYSDAKEFFPSVDDSDPQEASISIDDAGIHSILIGEPVSKDHKAHAATKESAVGAPDCQELSTNIDDTRIQSVLDCEEEMNEPNVEIAKESFTFVEASEYQEADEGVVSPVDTSDLQEEVLSNSENARAHSVLTCEDESKEPTVHDDAKETYTAVDASNSQEAVAKDSILLIDVYEPQEEEEVSPIVDDAGKLSASDWEAETNDPKFHAAAKVSHTAVEVTEPQENDKNAQKGLGCEVGMINPNVQSDALKLFSAVEVYEQVFSKQFDKANIISFVPMQNSESSVQITQDCPHPNAQEIARNKRDKAAAINKEKQPMISTVSLKFITLAEFKSSLSHSIHEQGSISGVKYDVVQQNAIRLDEQSTEENSIISLSSKTPAGITGGIIQSVKSYPIIPYTYIEQKDHEVFSIFNEQEKPSFLPNRKDLVIKSKLWDQRHCEYEEGWEEGSSDSSSSEEEDGKSLAFLVTQEKNAAVIDLVKNTMEKVHSDNADSISFEEGEEEEMLLQCRKNAARKGDLSPMHSKTNKKGRQRDKSWDGRVAEERIIRRPPMRLAKLKQKNQRV